MIPWLHGLAAMGDERWEEAIAFLQCFLEMLKDAGDRRQAFQNLAACYLALEEYDDALATLDEAERYAPGDPDILHSRGVTYACAGCIPEAITTFKQFARKWPRQARHLDTRKTVRQLRQAQRGKIPTGTYLIDHLQEQIIHNTAAGDWHLVEQKARRMIAAAPERPEGHFALGLSCLARYEGGERVEYDHDGQFVVTEVPRFFKLRIDSDLSTPYGDPMQGTLVYLNQQPGQGILISTLGLGAQ